jgi:NADH-quinone oxidoreductase subunit A
MTSEVPTFAPSQVSGNMSVDGTLINEVSYSGVLGVQAVAGDYLPILIFLVIATGLALVMAVLPMILLKQKPDSEKLSAYECGFESYGDARSKFDVRFYLVAILFIIFDLEVAFLFPWAITLGDIGLFGFWSMMIFLGVLTVGFIYEWKKGALEWE